MDKNINDLKCFGDGFYQKDIGAPGYAARQFIARLFELQEKSLEKDRLPRDREYRIFKAQFTKTENQVRDILVNKASYYPSCASYCLNCSKEKGKNCQSCQTCRAVEQAIQKSFHDGWPQVAKTTANQVWELLYGLYSFSRDSDVKAKKYFNGITATDAFKAFDKNFADSEQVIYQFLLKLNSEDLQKLKAPKGKSLKGIVIDIVTYRPMCDFCAGTALRYIENNELVKALTKNLGREGDTPKLSFWVSYIQDKSEENKNKPRKETLK